MESVVKEYLKIKVPGAGENPIGAKFYDLQRDTREGYPVSTEIGAWGGAEFVRVIQRHLATKKKYPDTPAAFGMPYDRHRGTQKNSAIDAEDAIRPPQCHIFSGTLSFAIQIFPVALEAFEARAFVKFAGFGSFKVFGEELDLAGFITFAALGTADDRQEAPVGVVDGGFEMGSQVRFAGVGMGGFDEVVGEAEKVGAKTGAHELLRGLRLGPTEMEWLAAGAIGLPALAGT